MGLFTASNKDIAFDDEERKSLISVGFDSINWGLTNNEPLSVDIREYNKNLTRKLATFVTLTINERLRGCIGVLDAFRPLVVDVAHNSFAAAFCDPRFPPLIAEELPELSLKISVLSPLQEIRFKSEPDLISKIKPGIDGLTLEFNNYKGSFIPSMWEQISEPVQFVEQLKIKAGLPTDFWNPAIRVYRYSAVLIK